MTTKFVPDTLEQAVWSRQILLTDVIKHSDDGSQPSISYTHQFADIDIRPPIGTIGDSYDYGLAE